MIQRRLSVLLLMIFTAAISARCDKSAPTPTPATRHAAARVVSLSPAATDLIVAMGLSNRLVAVSNYEPPRTETQNLPQVGDYRTADWEKISQLKVDLIITQYRSDKMPAGFTDRAAALGIRIFNRKIDSLDDAFNTIAELGTELDSSTAAASTQTRWKQTMDRVRTSVEGRPRRSALIVVGESGFAAAGPNTFLNDVLHVAGGSNVLTSGSDYPTLDREKLVSLNPEVIIQLLPGATMQTIEKAKAVWPTMPELRAVRNQEIHIIADADVLLPAFAVTRTAEKVAAILHGQPTTRPQ